ncbi:MAG: hypothetical protein IPP55_01015 [Anaerolineales bacterium]|nr:hypothetical protein [Anaerolineales bacterium]
MFLENELQVCDDFSQIKSEQPRFQIASGTILASEYPTKLQNYDKDAYLPKVDWRNLSSEELQLLKCTSTEVGNKKIGEWIGIVRIPQNILGYFNELNELSKGGNIEPLRKSIEDNHYRSAIGITSKWVQKTFSQDINEPLEGGFIFIGGGNKVTLTYATGPRYIGLHVDSFYQVPLEKRSLSPNRICINLGAGDRFLYFINLGLVKIQQKIKGYKSLRN